jgi:DNA-nicking Smr family endonuclease
MNGNAFKSPPRRPRPLSTEECELWTIVTRQVRPLAGKTVAASKPATPTAAADTTPPPRRAGLATSKESSRSETLAPFERRLKQRLARGVRQLDGSIDLHGLTLNQAYTALLSFLTQARQRGARVVLVITGKGSSPDAVGVLRQQVPQWLRSVRLRQHVLAFAPAHAGHGGEGALYVRLRRR